MLTFAAPPKKSISQMFVMSSFQKAKWWSGGQLSITGWREKSALRACAASSVALFSLTKRPVSVRRAQRGSSGSSAPHALVEYRAC